MNRICDYFAVCGGEEDLKAFDGAMDDSNDIMDINIHFQQKTPEGIIDLPQNYIAINETMNNLSANIEQKVHGVLESRNNREAYICYRRRWPGEEGPAVVDVIVVNMHKTEKVPDRYHLVTKTLNGMDASLRRSGALGRKPVYLAVRRQPVGHWERYHQSVGALTDLAVVNMTKGERPPPGAVCDPKLHRINSSKTGAKLLLALTRGPPRGLCDLPYQATILDRFPREDWPDFPFPAEVFPSFCFPKGLHLVRAPLQSTPQASSFPLVMTTGDGRRVFAAALTFYEPMARSSLTTLKAALSQRKKKPMDLVFSGEEEDARVTGSVVFVPKTLVVVSHHPFLGTLKQWLRLLYAISLSPSPVPLERIIAYQCLEMPLPQPGGPAYALTLQPEMEPIIFRMPPDHGLPLLDVPLFSLVSCLSVEHILTVYTLMLLEEKVVFYSRSAARVVEVMECLRALLFPFDWEGCYISRLNYETLEALDFPGAYLIGVHDDTDPLDAAPYSNPNALMSEVLTFVPPDTTLVALDQDYITSPATGQLKDWTFLPQRPASILKKRLEYLVYSQAKITVGSTSALQMADTAFTFAPTPDLADGERVPLNDKAVREAFVCLQCEILKGYTDFLITPDSQWRVSSNQWFDVTAFLQARQSSEPPSLQPNTSGKCSTSACLSTNATNTSPQAAGDSFLSKLTQSQLFSSFVQARTSSGSYSYVYFDKCLEDFHQDKEAFEIYDRPFLVDERRRNLIYQHQDESFDNLTVLDSDIDVSDMIGLGIHNRTEVVEGPDIHDLPPGKLYACYSSIEDSPGQNKQPTASWPKVLDPALLVLPERTAFRTLSSRKLYARQSSNSLVRPQDERITVTPSRQMGGKTPVKSQQEVDMPKVLAGHAFAAWFLCLPVLVESTPPHCKESILLGALGCLEKMQSVYKILPDEALYRTLLAACENSGASCSEDVAHIFQELQENGIQPNAVTYAQYTKAVAEVPDHPAKPPRKISELSLDRSGNSSISSKGSLDEVGDPSLEDLEIRGRQWRHSQSKNGFVAGTGEEIELNLEAEEGVYANLKSHPPVAAVHISTTFLTQLQEQQPFSGRASKSKSNRPTPLKVSAIWGSHVHSEECQYRPLDEEVMAYWVDNPSATQVVCPFCKEEYTPKLYYANLDPYLKETLSRLKTSPKRRSSASSPIVRRGSGVSQARSRGGSRSLSPQSTSYGESQGQMEHSRANSTSSSNLPFLDTVVESPTASGVHRKSFFETDMEERSRACSSTASFLDHEDFPPRSPSIGSTSTPTMRPSKSMPPRKKSTYSFWSQDNSPRWSEISDLAMERVDEALQVSESSDSEDDEAEPSIRDCNYLSPFNLRYQLEEFIFEHGPDSLTRENLWRNNLTLFWNLWWYCARFELPLPLGPESGPNQKNTSDTKTSVQGAMPKVSPRSKLWIGIIAWDKKVALGSARFVLRSSPGGFCEGPRYFGRLKHLMEHLDLSRFCSDVEDAVLESFSMCYARNFNKQLAIEKVMKWILKKRAKHKAFHEFSIYQLLEASEMRTLVRSIGSSQVPSTLAVSNDSELSEFDQYVSAAKAKICEEHPQLQLVHSGFPSDLALKCRDAFGHLC